VGLLSVQVLNCRKGDSPERRPASKWERRQRKRTWSCNLAAAACIVVAVDAIADFVAEDSEAAAGETVVCFTSRRTGNVTRAGAEWPPARAP
jgi:hypothetical protein